MAKYFLHTYSNVHFQDNKERPKFLPYLNLFFFLIIMRFFIQQDSYQVLKKSTTNITQEKTEQTDNLFNNLQLKIQEGSPEKVVKNNDISINLTSYKDEKEIDQLISDIIYELKFLGETQAFIDVKKNPTGQIVFLTIKNINSKENASYLEKTINSNEILL